MFAEHECLKHENQSLMRIGPKSATVYYLLLLLHIANIHLYSQVKIQNLFSVLYVCFTETFTNVFLSSPKKQKHKKHVKQCKNILLKQGLHYKEKRTCFNYWSILSRVHHSFPGQEGGKTHMLTFQ